jgi:hypothetical protein
MFKRVSDSPEVDIGEVCRDIAWSILYLCGILCIELLIKPKFGESGVPIIPNAIFIIFEIGLLIKVLHRSFLLLDAFAKDMANSWLSTKIVTIQPPIQNRIFLPKRHES